MRSARSIVERRWAAARLDAVVLVIRAEIVIITVTFDTLAYVKTLREAGIPEPQAEAQASALANVLRSGTGELATKQDIRELALATKHDRNDAVQRIHDEMKLLKWMVGLSLALSAATLTLLGRVAISLLMPH